jgi:hypothetical protein
LDSAAAVSPAPELALRGGQEGVKRRRTSAGVRLVFAIYLLATVALLVLYFGLAVTAR